MDRGWEGREREEKMGRRERVWKPRSALFLHLTRNQSPLAENGFSASGDWFIVRVKSALLGFHK